MPTNDSELQAQARRILDAIAFIPFEQCQPLTRDFARIPARPGIYAIRHKTDGLLYIGKTKSLRGRFSGGHKAFLWAWLDKYTALPAAMRYIILKAENYARRGARRKTVLHNSGKRCNPLLSLSENICLF
ncbi:GIY-YIG nuclease family protein [Nostoc edaphicum]|uniref:GIY-YIG nuclease family protein n=1 Tax=Nostoc edaphicum TaxID=264686 RepID=UPI0019329872|nr:GIY-YIG nuclease family protein [Nostoc edaphicum]